MAEMVVQRVTDLESGINYHFIQGILDHLYKEGSYIALEKGKDELDDSYFIDLKADINVLVKKKSEYIQRMTDVNYYFPSATIRIPEYCHTEKRSQWERTGVHLTWLSTGFAV